MLKLKVNEIDVEVEEGLSVLLMTSEMNDLLSLSDRILVMADGKISKEFYRGNVNQEEIFKASVS